MNAKQGLSVPTGIAWQSSAGAFCHLGAVAVEQSVRGLAVQNLFYCEWLPF